MATFAYRLAATGQCPVDGAADAYEIEIIATAPIMVEEILDAVRAAFEAPVTQENATLALSRALPAAIRTRGTHSGVEVEVCAP